MKRCPLSPKRSSIGGYTAMEVVMSAGLFAVGATGVLAMQRGSISGNLRAHRVDVATSIASTWIDRMRADAVLWTTPDASTTTGYKSRPLLKNVPASGSSSPWVLPTRTSTNGSNPSFDLNGRELPTGAIGAENTEFCVEIRQTWIVPDRMMRADVRVYWPSGSSAAANSIATAAGVCNAYTNADDYSSIISSSLIRGNF